MSYTHIQDCFCDGHSPATQTCLRPGGPVPMGFLESQSVRVTAQGPASLAFQTEEAGSATYKASVCAAGMYLVHVEVNSHPLSGWPKPLHVTAAASEASRSASANQFSSCHGCVSIMHRQASFNFGQPQLLPLVLRAKSK